MLKSNNVSNYLWQVFDVRYSEFVEDHFSALYSQINIADSQFAMSKVVDL